MVTDKAIRDFASEIAKIYSPEKIILFGSRARGAASDDSDVDMMVMMEFEGSGVEKAVEIRTHIRPRFALDLLVRRPKDVSWRIANRDYFLQDVMKEGIVLYAAARS